MNAKEQMDMQGTFGGHWGKNNSVLLEVSI